jgi:hypothetical protein
MRDQRERPDSAEPVLSYEPIENSDSTEPTEPIDSTDPTEPIERIDPVEPIERTESRDHNDQREAMGR